MTSQALLRQRGRGRQRWNDEFRRRRDIYNLSDLPEEEESLSVLNNNCPDGYETISITSSNKNTELNYCINKYINNNPRFCYRDDGGVIMVKKILMKHLKR